MGQNAMNRPALTKVLFVCSQNKLRSPTAEQVFSRRHDLEVDSAGTNNDAENPLTAELVAWADVIFTMEKTHRSKIQRRFKAELGHARLVCLDIPDIYPFMDPDLVTLLKDKVSRYLPKRPEG
jgi:predicted protein tyrosine phosphatase